MTEAQNQWRLAYLTFRSQLEAAGRPRGPETAREAERLTVAQLGPYPQRGAR